ncbi:sulfate/molybdate ABC transporter ATP-binding protein [Anaeromicropila populeti]|uniref:Molybdate transport system ATP-binding protein n=1 Tax=Anaeromicropila populeti TaxID=37658 RepID=A0A1I6HVF3_9FIRM|nr:ATP-binding cassette domain-containing protein [Anaeromicropila populeti]SFR58388.1 molybdate transport system ATP-binding protein [Anaeromicropila populeti]
MTLEVSIKKRLKGFSLETEFQANGEYMGILGASGSGKSMTLRCIAGIEKPSSGKIVLNGRTLFDSEEKINIAPRNRKVGYLFQNYALFPTMRVKDNIKIAIGKKNADKQKVIRNLIERLQLDGLEERYPCELSGGQQQRVALARILANEPDVILLDEPFSALDSYLKEVLQKEVLEILKDYHGEVLMVSHSRDELYRFCEKLTVLGHGQQLLTGATKQIFKNPVKYQVCKLTGCKNVSKIKKISSHTLYAEDWKIVLKTELEISERIQYVGIRAHDLVPWNGERERENVFPVNYFSSVYTPFEIEFIVKKAGEEQGEEIWWKISQQSFFQIYSEETLPEYMSMPKQFLMLLE